MVAAVVQLVIGIYQHGLEGMVDGVSIFLAIAIITFVTAGNTYVKEKQFQELQKKQDESTCLVIRAGIQSTISTEELVVGDLVIVSYGMTVPADVVLISSSGVSCDEGALTGEPDELKKFHVTDENYEYNPNPFMLRSTLCVSGEGRALVVAVGPHTLSGRADAILNIEAELTPLQMKLETIAN
jgi:magnesium-transporting ATPase (P-type)